MEKRLVRTATGLSSRVLVVPYPESDRGVTNPLAATITTHEELENCARSNQTLCLDSMDHAHMLLITVGLAIVKL